MQYASQAARAFAGALAIALSGCALSVPTAPVQLGRVPTSDPAQVRLLADADVRFSTGYERTLRSGSRWTAVGAVSQGTVYRPLDAVFSIEGRHVHEAYLVIQGKTLRGFFLPAESAFSPLDPPISLNLGEPS